MAEGLTTNLVWVAFVVGLLGFWIASRDLSFPVALFLSVVKIAVPFVYFAWLFDGTWTFLDDMSYQSYGTEMLRLGYTPITALTNPEGIVMLTSLSGGSHILYGWWNLLGQYFFGEHYYSAVFLNVVLTFVSGFFFVRMLRELGFSRRYQHWCLVFFLLQWDVLVWSSFPNLKDILVMTLTTVSIFLLVKLSREISIPRLGILALVLSTFSLIRFYIIPVTLAAVGAWMFFNWRDRRKYILLLGVIMAFFFPRNVGDVLENVTLAEMIFGLLRFPLSPQPWSIDENYSFLLLPSIIHWVLFVPTLFGGWFLWRRFPLARLPLIYLIAVIAVGAIVPEAQGPRHRVQVTFIFAWMQFHFLWLILRSALSGTALNRSQISFMRESLDKGLAVS